MSKRILSICVGLLLWTAPLSAQQVPNGLPTVQAVLASGSYQLGSHDGQATFVDAVICALNRIDSRWGNLRKSGGQTNIHGHAEDAALYLSDTPGQSVAVDFIASAGSSAAHVYWNPDQPRYSGSDWTPPHNCATDPTPPTPPVANLDAVLNELAAIRTQLSNLKEDIQTIGLFTLAVNEGNRQISERLETVLQSSDRIIRQLLSPPEYRGGVAGFPLTLRPTVKPVTP